MIYEELIERVEQIDETAATYLRGEAKQLPNFQPLGKLSHCFFWDKTPHRHDYWSRIERKLKGEEND